MSRSFLLAAAFAGALPTLFAGSLWVTESNNEQGIYADKRARNIGDILTIVVEESTVTNQAQEITTYDESTNGVGLFVNNLVNQFVAAMPAFITAATGVKAAPAATTPTLDFTAKSNFNGGGSTTGRLSINTRAAVTVVDVLPNGNLVIEGAKIIQAGKETQYGYIRGIVRAADVQRDNTVVSTNIADARVEYIPEGELTEAQKKGWLLGIYDRIKPF